jgi:predicted RNA-binding protein YlxR (DUF448 family)
MAASDRPGGGGAPGESPRLATRKTSGRGRDRSTPRPKHVPERTCVACRQVAGKRTLVRVVRTVTGGVEVDPTGRKNGRGAYLHADPACWDVALKRGALNVALKVTIGEADLAAIRAYRDEIGGGASAQVVPTPRAPDGNDHAEDLPSATME